jgi:hypothetical protein
LIHDEMFGGSPMTVVGQKLTSRRVRAKSVDTLIADIARPPRHVRFVPIGDITPLLDHLVASASSALIEPWQVAESEAQSVGTIENLPTIDAR